MRFLMLALMLVLAGCTAPVDPAPDDLTAGEAPREEAPSEGSKAFGWTMTAGAPGGGPDVALMSDNHALFAVPEDREALRVTATWTCTSPTCDLTVELWAPGPMLEALELLTEEATASGQGSGEVVLEIGEPAAGEWLVAAHSDGATVGVDGTFAWTVS